MTKFSPFLSSIMMVENTTSNANSSHTAETRMSNTNKGNHQNFHQDQKLQHQRRTAFMALQEFKRNEEQEQHQTNQQLLQHEHESSSVWWSPSSFNPFSSSSSYALRPDAAEDNAAVVSMSSSNSSSFSQFQQDYDDNNIKKKNDNKVFDLIDILDNTEEILDRNDKITRLQKQGFWAPQQSPEEEDNEEVKLSSSLEPIPLGPQGIPTQNIVKEVSLKESGKMLMVGNNNTFDQESLFSTLASFLTTNSTTDNATNTGAAFPQETVLAATDKKIKTNTISSSEVEWFNTTTANEVPDLSYTLLKRKFIPSKELSSPSTFFNFGPKSTAVSTGISNKKQRFTELITFDDDLFDCVDQKEENDSARKKLHHHQNQSPSPITTLNSRCSGDSSSISAAAAFNDGITVCSTTSSNDYDYNYDNNEEDDEHRFRPYQYDQWKERYQDLVNFKAQHGHCLVPHNYPKNQHLSQWIKRQRYQYKLKNIGRHSTLTDERQSSLEELGFVWDSHKAAWMEKFESLKEFNAKYGYSTVPSNYIDRSLAIWVKCQRRQYKLFQKGCRSAMTQERFLLLDRMGFDWNPRNLK